jgi:hypothetical protein
LREVLLYLLPLGPADTDMRLLFAAAPLLLSPLCNTLQPEYSGIVTMHGCADAAGKAVLMLSCAREPSIRLLELPAFTERGVLPDVSEPV